MVWRSNVDGDFCEGAEAIVLQFMKSVSNNSREIWRRDMYVVVVSVARRGWGKRVLGTPLDMID